MRDDLKRLLDIIEAIERIEKYGFKGREVFDCDLADSELDRSSPSGHWRGSSGFIC